MTTRILLIFSILIYGLKVQAQFDDKKIDEIGND